MTVFHAFRYDDFSAASCTVVEERLVEMLLTHAIPCTFAAVPFVCDPSSLLSGGTITLVPLPKSKADLLKPLLRRKLAEVALHGYAHLSLSRIRGQQEFSDAMPIATQRALLRRGKEHLEDVFETSVRLFVPPGTDCRQPPPSCSRKRAFRFRTKVAQANAPRLRGSREFPAQH